MGVCSSVWWSYCGCQYYSMMDKTRQTAERLLLQCSDASHHHWTDKLIYGNCCITTDELWSILFMDKGSVMAITEEPGCSKVYSLGAMIADRCTQRQGEQLPLVSAPIWQWSLGLPVADCHGGLNLDPTLWTWTKMQSIEWRHMTSPKKKFKRVPYAGKNISLSGWSNIFVSLLPREWTAISNCYIETLESLNDCFCQVHPMRKMSEVLLLHDNARLHTGLCTTEAITNLNGQCAAFTLQFSPCTIRISTAWSFEKKKKNPVTPLHHWQATAGHRMSVAKEEGEKLLLDGNTYPRSRLEKCCWQDGDYIEK